jgi:hypothetical protein
MAKVERWWEVHEMEAPTVWQALVTKDGLDYYYNTETQETSWEKPEELMTEDEINSAGEWLWVPHPEEVFVAGKVLEKSKRSVKVQAEDGQIHSAARSESFEMKRSSLKRIVEDLTLLDDMSAPLILNDLRRRFENQDIYTNVGTILISINPYEHYDIYSEDVVRRYIKARMANKEMPPHVFNTGHDAFYGVTGFNRDQSVIISGESGAGKTEATKQVLKYLATIAGSIGNVEKKLLQANPILEAFGNAKTLRNDNSSRFGKYVFAVVFVFLFVCFALSRSLQAGRVVVAAATANCCLADRDRRVDAAPITQFQQVHGGVLQRAPQDHRVANDQLSAGEGAGHPADARRAQLPHLLPTLQGEFIVSADDDGCGGGGMAAAVVACLWLVGGSRVGWLILPRAFACAASPSPRRCVRVRCVVAVRLIGVWPCPPGAICVHALCEVTKHSCRLLRRM